MKVSIKSFGVEVELKNKGIEFGVFHNDGTHLGDVILTKTKVIWCEGRRPRSNGKELTWEKFRNFMNTL